MLTVNMHIGQFLVAHTYALMLNLQKEVCTFVLKYATWLRITYNMTKKFSLVVYSILFFCENIITSA